MMRTMRTRSAVAAVAIGAAALTGAGFGIASAMTPETPPAATQHQAPASGVDKPEAGDTPDSPGAVDKPEAGDTPDSPGAVDKPEAGDTPDAPGQN